MAAHDDPIDDRVDPFDADLYPPEPPAQESLLAVANVPAEFLRITNPRQRLFLRALIQHPSIKKACAAAGVSRMAVIQWRARQEPFRQAFAVAMEAAISAAEDAAWERAIEGRAEPVFWEGMKVGEKQIPSDTLMQFLLKGASPEKYANRIEHSGPSGGPLALTVERVLVDAPAATALPESVSVEETPVLDPE